MSSSDRSVEGPPDRRDVEIPWESVESGLAHPAEPERSPTEPPGQWFVEAPPERPPDDPYDDDAHDVDLAEFDVGDVPDEYDWDDSDDVGGVEPDRVEIEEAFEPGPGTIAPPGASAPPRLEAWGDAEGYEAEPSGVVALETEPAEPERQLTPTEERIARRTAKLAYRGSRIDPVYDVSGPNVRLGVLWFLLAWAGFAFGSLGVAAVFVSAATVAALQIAAHLMVVEDTNSRIAAGVITAVIGTSALFDARIVGVTILLGVVAAFAVASQTIDPDWTVVVASLTLRASLPLGSAVAALVYLHRIDAWVFLIVFAVVSMYDAGSFLVGTGSAQGWVGPLAGVVGGLVVVFGAAGFQAPPLTENTTWLLGGAAIVACPLGNVVASAMLPRPEARAPALRRLDSYLVAAPLVLALFLAIGGNRPLR